LLAMLPRYATAMSVTLPDSSVLATAVLVLNALENVAVDVEPLFAAAVP